MRPFPHLGAYFEDDEDEEELVFESLSRVKEYLSRLEVSLSISVLRESSLRLESRSRLSE